MWGEPPHKNAAKPSDGRETRPVGNPNGTKQNAAWWNARWGNRLSTRLASLAYSAIPSAF